MPAKKTQDGQRPLNPLVGQKIAQLRSQLRESQAIFGERFGVEQATVSRWEKGFQVAREHEEPLARLAGMTVSEFFYSDQGPRLVPIVGDLTVGAKFTPVNGKTAPLVEHIKLSIGDPDQVAVRVQDDSMYPAYRKGDTIIAKRLPKGRTKEAIGKDCVIVTKGAGYIRTLTKGSKNGLYRLRAIRSEDDVEDVEVDWVAPIHWISRTN